MREWALLAVVLFLPTGEWWKEEQEATGGGNLVQTVRAEDGASRLDWEGGRLEAVGIATCDPATALGPADCYRRALMAARVLAYQKLAETLHGVAVDGYATLNEELLTNSRLETATRGLVRAAQVVEETREQTEDGSILARVTLRLSLYGGGQGETSIVGDLMPDLLATAPPEPLADRPGEEFRLPSAVTGLILDAAAVGAKPALSPAVRVEDGGLVYGRSVADTACAGEIGLVAYTSSVQRARRLEHRVGESPLVVRVVSTEGPNKADMAIEPDDARVVLAADRQDAFLSRCAVAVVLD